jgi:hypothetical protein
MAMRLFFVLVTVGGSAYLLYRDRTDKYAMGAMVASSLGLLLQLNWLTLRVQYARTTVWAAIAICAGLIWTRQGTKTGSTVAAGVAFVSGLTVALSLRLLR